MSPDLLPSIAETRAITQSLAMLDAILCPWDWDARYYSFNCRWSTDEEMASMRDGSGDGWFLLFGPVGAALKGFAHELADDRVPQAIQREVPKEFSSFLAEAAFSMQNATFCYWRRTSDPSWTKVSNLSFNDGSTEMLSLLVSGPGGYKAWAEGYFEVPVDVAAAAAVFAHQPLTEALVAALNAEADLAEIYDEADEIGYPRPGD